MAFTTLAERFEQRSREIYNKFSPSSDQFVTIKPNTDGVFGSNSRVKSDNRSVPTVSVLRDTRRVSRFLTSPEGVLFLGKQTLLQTGNTFENTRIFNPASPLLNVVPFVHARRHIPTSTVFGDAVGLLQKDTVNNITSKFVISGDIQALSTNRRGPLKAVGSIASTYVSTSLKNAANSIVPIPNTFSKSRPEYSVFYENGNTGPVVFAPQPLSQRGVPRTSLQANVTAALIDTGRKALVNATVSALNRVIPKSLRNTIPTPDTSNKNKTIPTFANAAKEFKENFYRYTKNGRTLRDNPQETGYNRLRSRFYTELQRADVDGPGNVPLSQKESKIGESVLSDTYNKAQFVRNIDNFDTQGNLVGDKLNYANITTSQEQKSDIIKFTFRDATDVNSKPVHFRALLSTIRESVKPEFNEQRYVGRTERFVTYAGVKRGVNLSFNIVAFSSDEVEGMWTKVNYLTGLAFPNTTQNGFMVPPLFKMSIGKLYDDQPCYIETLDYDFLDETITFDIDREVPFAINVTMQVSLLEKRSKFYDSPFYKITEDAEEIIRERRNAINQASALDLFNRQS